MIKKMYSSLLILDFNILEVFEFCLLQTEKNCDAVYTEVHKEQFF